MTAAGVFAKLQPYLVDHPRALIGAETVQLVIMREILDYTVLRTEETRELNTVHTPFSINKAGEPVRRVAFLATKQKAAETRELEHLLRTAVAKAGMKHVRRSGKPELVDSRQKGDEEIVCYLKDNLCLACPRCGLYGATSTVAGQQQRANIKHRIEYSTAFSLLPFEQISTALTFNAINDLNQTTGQALGDRFVVQPASLFPSIVTLKSVTQHELILVVKTLLACKSYGAESRIGGDARNTIWGIIAGWEEVITSLELTLELADLAGDQLTAEEVGGIIEKKYKPMAGNPRKAVVLGPAEVDALVQACGEIDLDKPFLERAYADMQSYRDRQFEA